MAALEGGVAGLAVASGQAALHLGLATIAGAGSHVLASRALYGGSQNLLGYTMKRFGIETTFIDPRDKDAWRDNIRPQTKVLFAETLGNPGLDEQHFGLWANVIADRKSTRLNSSHRT